MALSMHATSLRGQAAFRPSSSRPAQRSRAPVVAVRAAGGADQITVDVDKPLGLKLEQSTAAGGGLVVKVRGPPV